MNKEVLGAAGGMAKKPKNREVGGPGQARGTCFGEQGGKRNE